MTKEENKNLWENNSDKYKKSKMGLLNVILLFVIGYSEAFNLEPRVAIIKR